MITLWLKAILQWIVKGIGFLLKNWKATLFVVCCVIIYAHAIRATERVQTLEKQNKVLSDTIKAYKAKEAEQKAKARQETKQAVTEIRIVEKAQGVSHERIKIIYRTDPQSADWATTPVPDAVADELRDH